MWSALSRLDPPPLAPPIKPDDGPPSDACVSAGGMAPALPATCTVGDAPTEGVITAREPGAHAEPPKHAGETACDDASKEWDAFSSRRLDTALFHGTALLPGFPLMQRKTHAASYGDGTTRHTVNVSLWNSYWSAFSERFAARIDDVQEYLSGRGGESAGGQRRVLIAASLEAGPQMDSLKDYLVVHAHCLGALEHVSRERCVVMLQFTSAFSAEVFAAWASSLTLSGVWAEISALEQPNSNCHLLVRIVSHDTSMVTPTLRLGSNIVLPTPFLVGLFKGLFDAENVTYQGGSFLIEFASALAAQIALHSLQRSFLEVFGLTLTFTEQPPERGHAFSR